MKCFASLVCLVGLAGVSCADCHGVSVSGRFGVGGYGYGHNVGVGLYGGAYAAPVVTVAAPVLTVQAPACACGAPAGDAGLGPVLLSASPYVAYSGSVGAVFLNAGYGYGSFGVRHGVRDVRVVEVVRDRNVRAVRRVNANPNSGVVGIAKAAVSTVRNVLGAVIGR